VRRARRVDRACPLELDLVIVDVDEEAPAVTEQQGNEVDLDLVEQAGSSRTLASVSVLWPNIQS
jgi:hypothetical protein